MIRILIAASLAILVALPTVAAQSPGKSEKVKTRPPLQLPKKPFPKLATPKAVFQWFIFSKAETIRALRLARASGDADKVSRLLVLLEDVRTHAAAQAENVMVLARKLKREADAKKRKALRRKTSRPARPASKSLRNPKR